MELYEFSHDAWVEGLGPDHPNVIMNLESRGLFHLRRDDPENGIPFLEQAISSAEKTFGPEHARVSELRSRPFGRIRSSKH